MAKKTKQLTKAKKVTEKRKKPFGKPADITGVAGGCGCTGMAQDPVAERER
jgi:hypothetical protein